MTEPRGAIFAPEAYARAKMLDHSDWHGLLPRNITPSDIDAVVDNAGKILLMEFSTLTADWQKLKYGQRTLYENLVRAGGRKVLAVCVHVQVKDGLPINSVKDVLAFSPMFLNKEGLLVSVAPKVNEANAWVKFVQGYNAI